MPDGGTQSLPLGAVVDGGGPGEKPRQGLRLGRYELLVPIAQGGMAEVWIAQLVGDLSFSRIVALKTIRPDFAQDPGFRQSFFEEARIASRLFHANVVQILDLGEQGHLLFHVMPLIEGDSLAKLLRHHSEQARKSGGRGLGVPLALRIMIDTLAGLHAAHECTDDAGVPMALVHRDVSPHNILIGVDGVARLSDFGVARALGRLVDETDPGQVRGKPGYLAPEQVGHLQLDRRADLFAAGIVLWEMLSGKRLFREQGERPPLARLSSGEIPDLGAHAPEPIPAPITEAVMCALSRDPAGRFSTARQMSDALEEAAQTSSRVASAKELGAFVDEHAGHRVEQQRSLVRRALLGQTSRSIPRPAAGRTIDSPDGVHKAMIEPSGTAEIAGALRAFAATAAFTPVGFGASEPVRNQTAVTAHALSGPKTGVAPSSGTLAALAAGSRPLISPLRIAFLVSTCLLLILWAGSFFATVQEEQTEDRELSPEEAADAERDIVTPPEAKGAFVSHLVPNTGSVSADPERGSVLRTPLRAAPRPKLGRRPKFTNPYAQ